MEMFFYQSCGLGVSKKTVVRERGNGCSQPSKTRSIGKKDGRRIAAGTWF
jgi:hypothetical protein